MKEKALEILIVTFIVLLGIFILAETIYEWLMKDSVSVYIKMGADKVFVGSEIWIGLITNISWALGLICMGVMTVLAKLKHNKMGLLLGGLGMLLLINWILFIAFIG